MKVLIGATGRAALYALAATTGEVVISLGGDRNEVEALASAGARRTRRDNVPTVLVIKDPAAFADAVGRLSWKRVPAQILIDGSRVGQEVVTQIGERLSPVAPVVLAVSGSEGGVLGS